jgi:Ca2+-transporting ATPase
MTDPHSPVLSVPFTLPPDRSTQPENNTPASSYYGDTVVRTSSRRLLDNDSPDGDRLGPKPSGGSDFAVENKFAFSLDQLNKLLNPKNFSAFGALGGLSGLEKGLRTDVRSGLSMDETLLDGTATFDEVVLRTFVPPHDASVDELPMKQPPDRFADRRQVFGINKLPEKKLKSIWELMWIAYNDKVLILLSTGLLSPSPWVFRKLCKERAWNGWREQQSSLPLLLSSSSAQRMIGRKSGNSRSLTRRKRIDM